MTISAELMCRPEQIALASLAHEIAHLQLAHPRTGWHRWLVELLGGVALGGLALWQLRRPVWLLAFVVACWLTVWLMAKASRRRRAGRRSPRRPAPGPGRHRRPAAMAAMLTDLQRQENRIPKALAFLSGHPHPTRRLTALATTC